MINQERNSEAISNVIENPRCVLGMKNPSREVLQLALTTDPSILNIMIDRHIHIKVVDEMIPFETLYNIYQLANRCNESSNDKCVKIPVSKDTPYHAFYSVCDSVFDFKDYQNGTGFESSLYYYIYRAMCSGKSMIDNEDTKRMMHAVIREALDTLEVKDHRSKSLYGLLYRVLLDREYNIESIVKCIQHDTDALLVSSYSVFIDILDKAESITDNSNCDKMPKKYTEFMERIMNYFPLNNREALVVYNLLYSYITNSQEDLYKVLDSFPNVRKEITRVMCTNITDNDVLNELLEFLSDTRSIYADANKCNRVLTEQVPNKFKSLREVLYSFLPKEQSCTTMDNHKYNSFMIRCKDVFKVDSVNSSNVYSLIYAYMNNDTNMLYRINYLNLTGITSKFLDELRSVNTPIDRQITISIILSLLGKVDVETFNKTIDTFGSEVGSPRYILNQLVLQPEDDTSGCKSVSERIKKMLRYRGFIKNCITFFGVFSDESHVVYDLLYMYAIKDVNMVESISAIFPHILKSIDTFLTQLPISHIAHESFKEFFKVISSGEKYLNIRLCNGILNDNATDISIHGLSDAMKVLVYGIDVKPKTTDNTTVIDHEYPEFKAPEAVHIKSTRGSLGLSYKELSDHLLKWGLSDLINSEIKDSIHQQIKKDDERILKNLTTSPESGVKSVTESVQTKNNTELDKRNEEGIVVDDSNGHHEEFTKEQDTFDSTTNLSIITVKLCDIFGLNIHSTDSVILCGLLAHVVNNELPKPHVDEGELKSTLRAVRTLLEESKKQYSQSYALYLLISYLIYNNDCTVKSLGMLIMGRSLGESARLIRSTIEHIVYDK